MDSGLAPSSAPRNDERGSLKFKSTATNARSLRHSNRLAARPQRGGADRRDVRLIRLHRATLEYGRSRHQRVGAGGGERAGDVGADTAIDLDVDRPAGG